jgi:hypothetical protein
MPLRGSRSGRQAACSTWTGCGPGARRADAGREPSRSRAQPMLRLRSWSRTGP